MQLDPDDPEDVRLTLSQVTFDIQAAARLAESLAQQTDIYTPVIVHTMAAIAKSLASDADRLHRVVAPALEPPPLSVKDGETDHAATNIVHTPAPTPAPTEATSAETP